MILRLSNPFGPYHHSMQQGICNVAIDSALTGNSFTVWGEGTARKDYIYVTDFVRILFKLVQKGTYGEVFNVGSGHLASVNEILMLVKKHVPAFEWTYSDSLQNDVSQFALDTSKLRRVIGKFEFIGLEEGIKLVFDWKEGKDA